MAKVYVYQFLDRMATGKQSAMNRRNRGMGTGGTGTVTRKRGDLAPVDQASHAFAIQQAIQAWGHARADAIDQFRHDVHGGDWLEGFPL